MSCLQFTADEPDRYRLLIDKKAVLLGMAFIHLLPIKNIIYVRYVFLLNILKYIKYY